MAEQNVYDNAEFFHNYCALRGKSDNYNDLLEQPALWSLLPPLAGRRVLDLGCGFGDACARYADAGAAGRARRAKRAPGAPGRAEGGFASAAAQHGRRKRGRMRL